MRTSVALAVLLLFAVTASAELRPRVIFSWETRDSGGVTSSRLRQDIDLYLSRAFSETIALQMTLGASHHQLATERLDLPSADARALELRPSGSLRVDLGPVSTESTWAFRRTRNDVDGIESSRDHEQLGARIGWTPRRLVPGGELRAWRNRIGDSAGARSIANDLVSGSLDYNWRGLAVSAGRMHRIESDTRAGYERKTQDQSAGLSYNAAFAGGKLSVSSTSNGSLTAIEDSSGRSTRVPTYVLPSRALWGVDDTPLDTFDHPLVAYPTLIDTRVGVSTGINFGPEGASFQAIAFDVGRVAQIDEIHLVVRDEKLDPVVSHAGIGFDVYTSTDGERWTPHTTDVVVSFDAVRSQYEIAFAQVDTRWIKVVNFGVAAQPVFVTEGYLLFHTVVTRGGRDSDFRTLTSSTSIQFAPVRSVTFGYTGALYRTSQESGEALQSDIDDLSHTFSARYEPRGPLAYEARYELHDVETDRTFLNVHALAGAVRYTPRPQFSSMVLCDRREEATEVATADTLTCSFNFSARVYPTLDFNAGASSRRQTLSTGGTQTTRAFYASSTARVTPSLRILLSAAMNRSQYDDWSGALPPPPRDDRFTADVDWYRGRALGLGATLSWAETGSFSGIVQRYRVRWTPFGDGSVSITTHYTQDVDPYSDSRSQRILFSPRWQINSRAALNLTYSSVSTSGEQSFEADSLLASLILGR